MMTRTITLVTHWTENEEGHINVEVRSVQNSEDPELHLRTGYCSSLSPLEEALSLIDAILFSWCAMNEVWREDVIGLS
jgi:hypothetical protein